MLEHLTLLENKTIYLLREAYSQLRENTALLWSIGKDSTTMLWIARKAFFGTIPFPVMHIDTSYKFKEIYEFRQKYASLWNLNLIVTKNEAALKEGMNFKKGRFECCDALKTQALKLALNHHHFKGVYLAIRRDEHGIRAKERYFSPRNEQFQWNYQNQPPELWNLFKSTTAQDEHIRIHPMLDWTEIDIWRYIEREKIPVNSLYFSKNFKRFRSIGCETCCEPVDSKARNLKKIIHELETTTISERSGRAQDKENSYNMQKLRSLGYM
ncbi:MAG: sulfate adenylyltransferase subunit 2 [Deltaproteobacteria bacterium]|nr:sulfate adenylyltransferase subunit 2 [Deltaproteobacteria bacterium]